MTKKMSDAEFAQWIEKASFDEWWGFFHPDEAKSATQKSARLTERNSGPTQGTDRILVHHAPLNKEAKGSTKPPTLIERLQMLENQRKEGIQMTEMKGMGYLETEDRNFAIAHRLTEQEFLDLGFDGKLINYANFCIDRAEARREARRLELNEPWALPSSLTKQELDGARQHGLSEKDWAKYLLGQQAKAVGGVLSGAKAHAEMEADRKFDTEQEAANEARWRKTFEQNGRDRGLRGESLREFIQDELAEMRGRRIAGASRSFKAGN